MRLLGKVALKAVDRPLKFKTVFPFDFFPNTIKVDDQKITITYVKFFGIKEVIALQTQDLLSVEMYSGPLFGSIKITTRFFTDKERVINWLWKRDAVKLRRVLQQFIENKTSDN